MPYAERLCWGCDLRKVENVFHLLLVYSNTQKVKERFCLALSLTHISTLAELMQIANTVVLTKFVACYQYKRNYVSSMICLLSNGLSGPKQT